MDAVGSAKRNDFTRITRGALFTDTRRPFCGISASDVGAAACRVFHELFAVTLAVRKKRAPMIDERLNDLH